MRIRFDAVRSGSFLWKESIEFAPEEVEGLGLLTLGVVECRGSVSFSDPDFVLHGGLAWSQGVTCDRCLKSVEIDSTAEMDILLAERERPRSSGPAPAETELKESDLGVVEVQGDSFETRPLVLEQIALGVPTKPLCREDCRGLCPVCGIDRNEGSCDCETRTVDSRWAGLAALKDSLPDGRPGES